MADDKYLYELWDFLDGRGENVILQWVESEKLTNKSRAALNQKIKRLAQMDYSLAVNSKLLAPIRKYIYKLVIHADIMLRPMLCRGPISNDAEYTFLLGAVERGWKLPKGSKEKAEEHREIILKDNHRRCKHERIP